MATAKARSRVMIAVDDRGASDERDKRKREKTIRGNMEQHGRRSLTGDGHPWIPRYVRDAGLARGRLLAGRQGINDGRCSSRLMIELRRRCHGCRSGRHGRGSRRGGDETTRRSAILMMVTESIVNHGIGRCGCHVTGEAGGVTARLVAGGSGVHSGGGGEGCAGCRGGAETGHHAGRGAEGGGCDRLLLLMMMMRRRSGHVGIHAGRGACRR